MREHPCAKNRRKSELIYPTHTYSTFIRHDGKTHNMWCSSRATHLFHRRSQYLGVRPTRLASSTYGELRSSRRKRVSSGVCQVKSIHKKQT